MIPTDSPYVLLDDARLSGASPARLYTHPVECLTARCPGDVAPLLDQLHGATARGLHVAGYLSYDAGSALLPHLAQPASALLGWFGLFERYEHIEPDVVPSLLPDPAGAWLSALQPGIARTDYAQAFAAVQAYIRSGDIYQANLTFPLTADYVGNPLALYAALRPRAAAGYGGIIWTGEQHYLSFSPELFFALKDGRVTTKPMKGTAPRRDDLILDAAEIETLQTDPKQRAENLMIVDLLRNDLSRVCEPGSVAVPELFRVESYPTVHQMTSTVTGLLPEKSDVIDVMTALFPCGSITGAPKIRAMQVIAEVEGVPRGIYCGSIGRIDPNGDAAFNVAIRTFTLCDKTKKVSLGLGSGVVSDSHEDAEWAECLAKGDFALVGGYGFDLIETMRFDPKTGIARLELHLQRMMTSATTFGYEFDRHALRNHLHVATFRLTVLSKIRLLLSKRGTFSIEIRPITDAIEVWRVAVVPLPVDAADFRLRHKTTDRAFYDDARNASDADEVLFVTTDGFLTEGSITAVFVERDGVLLTPPLSRGALPSVLRQELIGQSKAIEADLTPDDLAAGFFIGNSVRGLIPAKRVA